jgi:hypothetical protein
MTLIVESRNIVCVDARVMRVVCMVVVQVGTCAFFIASLYILDHSITEEISSVASVQQYCCTNATLLLHQCNSFVASVQQYIVSSYLV